MLTSRVPSCSTIFERRRNSTANISPPKRLTWINCTTGKRENMCVCVCVFVFFFISWVKCPFKGLFLLWNVISFYCHGNYLILALISVSVLHERKPDLLLLFTWHLRNRVYFREPTMTRLPKCALPFSFTHWSARQTCMQWHPPCFYQNTVTSTTNSSSLLHWEHITQHASLSGEMYSMPWPSPDPKYWIFFPWYWPRSVTVCAHLSVQ